MKLDYIEGRSRIVAALRERRQGCMDVADLTSLVLGDTCGGLGKAVWEIWRSLVKEEPLEETCCPSQAMYGRLRQWHRVQWGSGLLPQSSSSRGIGTSQPSPAPLPSGHPATCGAGLGWSKEGSPCCLLGLGSSPPFPFAGTVRSMAVGGRLIRCVRQNWGAKLDSGG